MTQSLVFIGSGPVAAASLKFLAQHFLIEAVVTKPATASEMQFAAPAAALHQVTTKQELSELIATRPFASRLSVLVDFGIIVDQVVIDYFPLGIINSHFSLLPHLRGADPISFSILQGHTKTGVSLMLIVAAMDEGPILNQSMIDVASNTTTPQLTQQLISLSNKMLVEALPKYWNGELVPRPQRTDIKPSYSRKLRKDDGLIDWHKPAAQLEREIRAFIEWPKSRTAIAHKEVIITQAEVSDASGPPGKLHREDKTLRVYCAEGALVIKKLKPAGKAEMTAEAFLAGYGSLLS